MSCSQCDPGPTTADYASGAAQDAQRRLDRLERLVLAVMEGASPDKALAKYHKEVERAGSGRGFDTAGAHRALKAVYAKAMKDGFLGG